MKTETKWEQLLQDLDRTDERRDWRFDRNHEVGIDLDAVAVAEPPDPGAEARVGAFLDREEKLLGAYFGAPKGKRRTCLGRRITMALRADELLGRDLYEHLMKFGPRRTRLSIRPPRENRYQKTEIVVRVLPRPQQRKEKESSR